MAEATLSLTLTDLNNEVCDYFLWGEGVYSAASSPEQNRCDRIVKRGLSQFLMPAPLKDESTAHRWSFLTPTTTITTFPAFSESATAVDVYDSGNNETKVTMTATTFLSTHVGQVMTFAATGNTYVIKTYTSTTIIELVGDASGESDTDTITIDNDDLLLPDDFGGIEGFVTFASAEGRPPIQVRSEADVRRMRQESTSAARPKMVAVRPKKTLDTAIGARWEMMLWPAPDTAYTLGYRYARLLDVLATGTDFFWAGAAHRETIITSCLSIAEQRAEGFRFYHHDRFREALAASISYDRRNHPATSGYNRDDSDMPEPLRRSELRNVLVNGIEYS